MRQLFIIAAIVAIFTTTLIDATAFSADEKCITDTDALSKMTNRKFKLRKSIVKYNEDAEFDELPIRNRECHFDIKLEKKIKLKETLNLSNKDEWIVIESVPEAPDCGLVDEESFTGRKNKNKFYTCTMHAEKRTEPKAKVKIACDVPLESIPEANRENNFRPLNSLVLNTVCMAGEKKSPVEVVAPVASPAAHVQ